MYNDFILIGSKDDPASVKGKDILTALQTIKAKGAPFISRGDRSGTNIAELALWKAAGIDIAKDNGGVTQAELRNTHLKYHLQTAQILTAEQMQRYSVLRGYGSTAPGEHQHRMQ